MPSMPPGSPGSPIERPPAGSNGPPDRPGSAGGATGADDEHRHPDARCEEWLFIVGPLDSSHARGHVEGVPASGTGAGLISGYRIVERQGWYWAALVRPGHPLVVVSDWAVPLRSDPLLVKGAGLWAEHVCDEPFGQWTIANETYGVALDDPDEALQRAYGVPTAIAWDLEWYALDDPVPAPGAASGYEQHGVVHGRVELAGELPLEIVEAPSRRWHRWGEALAPVRLPSPSAPDGLRAPFRFPDGTLADWMLTPDGWHSR